MTVQPLAFYSDTNRWLPQALPSTSIIAVGGEILDGGVLFRAAAQDTQTSSYALGTPSLATAGELLYSRTIGQSVDPTWWAGDLAFNAAVRYGGLNHKEVVFSGTWQLIRQIDIVSGQTIRGVVDAKVERKAGTYAGNTLFRYNSTTAGITDVLFQNMELVEPTNFATHLGHVYINTSVGTNKRLRFIRCKFHEGMQSLVYLKSVDEVLFEDCEFYAAAISDSQRAMTIEQAANMRFLRCYVHNTNDGIYATSLRGVCSIDTCRFEDIGDWAALGGVGMGRGFIQNQGDPPPEAATSLWVKDSQFLRCGKSGVSVFGVQNVVCENNIAAYNGDCGLNCQSMEAVGGVAVVSPMAIYRGNLCHHNRDYGIAHSFVGVPAGLAASQSIEIDSNVCHDNGWNPLAPPGSQISHGGLGASQIAITTDFSGYYKRCSITRNRCFSLDFTPPASKVSWAVVVTGPAGTIEQLVIENNYLSGYNLLPILFGSNATPISINNNFADTANGRPMLDATADPNVCGFSRFDCGAGTNITRLLDIRPGQEVRIFLTANRSFVDSANLLMVGNATFAGTADSVIAFVGKSYNIAKELWRSAA